MRMKLPKEGGNIEFKEFLSPDFHLKKDKKQKLAAQMKNRLENGDGKCIYVVGVKDSGRVRGLTNFEFEQTLNVLKIVAEENSAKVVKVERFEENGKLIGKILIERVERPKFKQHVVVGVAGHVGSGKSTLIATLITGRADKDGKNWLYLNVLPHEIERGLTADLHYTFLAFSNGEPIHFKNPLDKREKSRLIKQAEKIVSFVDNVGHEVWLRTILRGLVGQNLDYGILVIDAVDGITRCTKEDLGIMLTMNLPVVACITKIDRSSKKKLEKLEKEVCTLLKNVGKIPYVIRSEKDVPMVGNKIEMITPIFETSAYSLEGYDLLHKLLSILPEREKPIDRPFLMYVDKVYNISSVGCVVSGCIMQGKLEVGKRLLLGPMNGGEFRKVKVRSIETHYFPLSMAEAGLLVGIALKGVRYDEISRGMIVCDEELKPRAVKSFEAEILVLNHPTKISDGYEPVLHLNTIASTVKLKMIDKKYLKAGESGKVAMTLKYKPQFLRENDKFVFREGKTKGIGTVTKILRFS